MENIIIMIIIRPYMVTVCNVYAAILAFLLIFTIYSCIYIFLYRYFKVFVLYNVATVVVTYLVFLFFCYKNKLDNNMSHEVIILDKKFLETRIQEPKKLEKFITL